MHERNHQRGITQVAAVVAEVPWSLDFLRERFVECLLAAWLVALQRKRDAEVHQRQGGQRLAALVVVQRAQRAERRTLHTRQHVGRIGFIGKAQVVGVLVAVVRMSAGQQIVVEAFQRLLQHRVGYVDAGVARIEQEFHNVRRQEFVDIRIAAPHREMPGRNLHRRDTAHRAGKQLLAPRRRDRIEAEIRRGLVIVEEHGPGLARRLLDAAIGVVDQIVHRRREWQRRQRADGQPRIDRSGHETLDRRGVERNRRQRVEHLRFALENRRPRRAHRHLEFPMDSGSSPGLASPLSTFTANLPTP